MSKQRYSFQDKDKLAGGKDKLTDPYATLEFVIGNEDDFVCFDYFVHDDKTVSLHAVVNSETGHFIQDMEPPVRVPFSEAVSVAQHLVDDAVNWMAGEGIDDPIAHDTKGWNQDTQYFVRAVENAVSGKNKSVLRTKKPHKGKIDLIQGEPMGNIFEKLAFRLKKIAEVFEDELGGNVDDHEAVQNAVSDEDEIGKFRSRHKRKRADKEYIYSDELGGNVDDHEAVQNAVSDDDEISKFKSRHKRKRAEVFEDELGGNVDDHEAVQNAVSDEDEIGKFRSRHKKKRADSEDDYDENENLPKGTMVNIRKHHSEPGKGLSYSSFNGTMAEDGFSGGWDVWDVLDVDGVEHSVYGFSLSRIAGKQARADEDEEYIYSDELGGNVDDHEAVQNAVSDQMNRVRRKKKQPKT